MEEKKRRMIFSSHDSHRSKLSSVEIVNKDPCDGLAAKVAKMKRMKVSE